MKKYDVVVLGGGPAGLGMYSIMKQAGKEVLIIEKFENNFGGTCLNNGCLPTKRLVKVAEIIEQNRKAEMLGLDSLDTRYNLEKVVAAKEKFISHLRTEDAKRFGDDLIFGHARFIDSSQIEVTDKIGKKIIIASDKFVIATGSRPRILPEYTIDGKFLYTSDEFLSNEEIPKKLLVVGGGAIGLEFASIYNTLGSEVTVVEYAPSILATEDFDTSMMAQKILGEKGIKISANTKLTSVSVVDSQVKVTYENETVIEENFDKVLFSIGRQANIDDLGLENTDVKVNSGKVTVNEFLQTEDKSIIAIGDVIPTLMLAHTAAYEAQVAAQNILSYGCKPYTNKVSPRVIFTSPNIASVGLTEKEASELYNIQVVNGPMMMSSKAIIDHDTEGRIKIVYNKETGVIVGANIIGKEATELIHELTLAITHKMTVNELKDTVHAHPSLSEAIWNVLLRCPACNSTEEFMKQQEMFKIDF